MTETTTKRQVSTGTCSFCGKTIAKSAMGKHLLACEARKTALENEASRSKAQPIKILHLQVEGQYAPMYWMHVEIAGGATLANLDAFLRDTWLECCGHLSGFRVDGRTYSISPMAEYGDKSMQAMLVNVLKPDTKFTHEYDFGTTTELTLKVVGERQGIVKRKSDVRVLARNNPPEFICDSCGKRAATVVCLECMWDGTGAFCKGCARKHLEEHDMFLPIVNSPRVGMCGYTGDAPDDWMDFAD